MKARLTPLRIVSLYAIVGVLWILFSDKAMMAIAKYPEIITRIGIIKGWVFVFATSLLIYFLIRRYACEREKIEKKIKESGQYNRALFENSMIGLALSRMDGSLVDINEAYANIIGRTVDETLKLTYWDITPEKYAEHEQKQLESLNATGSYGPYEKEYIHKDGRFVPVRLQGRIIEQNGEKMIWSSVEDISGRKRAEDALRKGEEKFRHVFETSNVGKSITLPNGKISVNKAFCDMLGYGQDELLNKTWQDLTPAEDINLTNDILKPMLRGEQDMVRFEKRYIHKNGTYVWTDVSTAIQRENDGTPLYFITTIVDINERKQVEQNLRLSEELFYKAFHVGPIGMTITRIADGKFIDANELFCRMFEFNRDEVIGHTSNELNMWTPEERRKLVQMQIESGGLHNFELLAHSKSGRPINLLFSSTLIEIKGENCHVTTMIDITDRKLMEEELRSHRQQLENLIKERTAELETKIVEIERMNKLFVGRELRIIELKDRIKELEKEVVSRKMQE